MCGLRTGLVALRATSPIAPAMKFTIVPAAATPRRASALIASSPQSKCTDESTLGFPPRATQAAPWPNASCETFEAAYATSAIAVTVRRSGRERSDSLLATRPMMHRCIGPVHGAYRLFFSRLGNESFFSAPQLKRDP